MIGVVVSINVGLPKDVAWQGRTVPTGDLEAACDRAGFRRQAESRWRRTGRPRRPWRRSARDDGLPAQILPLPGELPWAVGSRARDVRREPHNRRPRRCRLCIGDRFWIGSVVVEVGQPRDTCYRLGIRLERPEMAALMVAHRRPGFYVRVIEEGEPRRRRSHREALRRPRAHDGRRDRCPALLGRAPARSLTPRGPHSGAQPKGGEGSMRKLGEAAEAGGTTGNAGLGAGASAPLAWRGFRPLVVVASHEESADVRSFEFGTEDGLPLPTGLTRPIIVVRMKPNPDGPTVTRNYCCAVRPGRQLSDWRQEQHGLASDFLHQTVRAGSHLESALPGSFRLAAVCAPIVLISAGVGVTPMLAMLHGAAATAADGTRGRSGGCVFGLNSPMRPSRWTRPPKAMR